jgi:hypothetical protein
LLSIEAALLKKVPCNFLYLTRRKIAQLLDNEKRIEIRYGCGLHYTILDLEIFTAINSARHYSDLKVLAERLNIIN